MKLTGSTLVKKGGLPQVVPRYRLRRDPATEPI